MSRTTTTLTLAQFLLARIAEDEASARAAGSLTWLDGDHPTRSAVIADAAGQVVVYREGVALERQATHIARWDPARVLVECEVKRRIVAHHQELSGVVEDVAVHDGARRGRGASCAACEGRSPMSCPTLRLLALPYADHADYIENWRP